jgi:hypothetical protein
MIPSSSPCSRSALFSNVAANNVMATNAADARVVQALAWFQRLAVVALVLCSLLRSPLVGLLGFPLLVSLLLLGVPVLDGGKAVREGLVGEGLGAGAGLVRSKAVRRVVVDAGAARRILLCCGGVRVRHCGECGVVDVEEV